jgi:PKD repeat protein
VSPWDVVGGSYTCDENETIELTASANDVPADVPSLVFEWDLDSNPNFEEPGRQVDYNCNQAGNQTVRLRVRDKDYNSNEDDAHDGESFGTAQIEINNVPPVAVAAANPLTTTINVPIIFDSSGSYDPSPGPDTLTYRWNFGDGITMTTTSITVTHIYTDDGLYTASLRVYDGNGGTDDDTVLVRIANLPPTAVAVAAPTTVAKGTSVTFDGSGSSDPDDTNLTYQWDFGNGSPVANGVSVNYTYPNGGTYTAILTVTDDNNDSATASVVITVNNALPIAEAGADQTINEGNAATFDGSGSTDPDDTNLTYQWNFGDGSPTATGVSVNHTFQNGPANYTVTLTVTDSDGATDTDTLQVTVNNVAPTANAGSDQTVNEGDTVTFNGSGSDPGGDALTLFEWDFDYDGSNFNVDATGQNPGTTFPDGPATRTIALRVTDSDGAVSAVDTAQVTINNVPPTARANASATTITLGETITFDGSASSDPGADAIINYQWDFGDTNSGSGVNPTYTYSSAGQYDVTLTVTDEDGASDTDTIQITVN